MKECSMDVPQELSMHLEQVYKLVHQQVEKDYLQQLTLNTESSYTESQQQNHELLLQICNLKAQHHQECDQHYLDTAEQKKQLSDLKQRYDELLENYQKQHGVVHKIEQEKQQALAKLSQHESDNDQQLEQLKLDLEESNINHRVMKHHYRQLNDQNEKLKTLFDQTQPKLEELEIKYQQQTIELNALQESFDKIALENSQYVEQIAKQKTDLSLAMNNYYDGVLNIEKKVTTNIPT